MLCSPLSSCIHVPVQPAVLEAMDDLPLHGRGQSPVARGNNLLPQQPGEVRGHETQGDVAALSAAFAFLRQTRKVGFERKLSVVACAAGTGPLCSGTCPDYRGQPNFKGGLAI